MRRILFNYKLFFERLEGAYWYLGMGVGHIALLLAAGVAADLVEPEDSGPNT